jgi:hypothetical protein
MPLLPAIPSAFFSLDTSVAAPGLGVIKPESQESVPATEKPVLAESAVVSEQLSLSAVAVSEAGSAATIPIVSENQKNLNALIQGDKPVIKATTDLVGSIVSSAVSGVVPTEQAADVSSSVVPADAPLQSAPLGSAPAVDLSLMTPPAVAGENKTKSASAKEKSQTNPLVANAPGEQLVSQTDALVKGTLLTVQAIQEKASEEPAPEPLPVTPQPMVKGVALSTIVPMISSGRKNVQAVISGEKTLNEAAGSVASDAVSAVVIGVTSNLGQKLVAGVATAMGAPPATADAVGMFAAFTTGRLSYIVMEGTGANLVVMDQTKNWLDHTLSGVPMSDPNLADLSVSDPTLDMPLNLDTKTLLTE